jgi:two-component system, response regulator PdtaR
MNSEKSTILVVDEDPRVLATVGHELRTAGFKVLEAFDGPSAFEACMVHAPALAIIDYRMSGSTGSKMAQQITTRILVPVALMSAESNDAIVQEAIAAGVIAFLSKPVETRQLIPVVRLALQRARDLEALRSQVEQLNTALQGGRNVSLATGLIMAKFQIGREEAFDRLRHYARSNRIRLEEVASDLLRVNEEGVKLYESLRAATPGRPRARCTES